MIPFCIRAYCRWVERLNLVSAFIRRILSQNTVSKYKNYITLNVEDVKR